ncbi:MAG: response regulator transcription factor [Xanthomonadales bacterium]|nr:response regulator transcription factor [Xanthomonadales bacterium]
MQTLTSVAPNTALLIDHLAPARAWLGASLRAAYPQLSIVEAGSLAEARAALAGATQAPDLAIVDLGLLDGGGLRLIETLQRDWASTVCIVSTVFDDDAHVFPALRAGAQGYLLKDLPIVELARTLRGILDGRPPLSPSIARRLLRQFMQTAVAVPAVRSQALSARETEVLQLIAKGYTVEQTAAALGLSPPMASGHVRDVYRKLSLNSRAEAVPEGAKLGLASRT